MKREKEIPYVIEVDGVQVFSSDFVLAGVSWLYFSGITFAVVSMACTVSGLPAVALA